MVDQVGPIYVCSISLPSGTSSVIHILLIFSHCSCLIHFFKEGLFPCGAFLRWSSILRSFLSQTSRSFSIQPEAIHWVYRFLLRHLDLFLTSLSCLPKLCASITEVRQPFIIYWCPTLFPFWVIPPKTNQKRLSNLNLHFLDRVDSLFSVLLCFDKLPNLITNVLRIPIVEHLQP